MKLWGQPTGESVCASCGTPVAPNETELMGGNFLYWRVYRCRRCLHRRRIWTLGVCVLIILVLVLNALIIRWI